MESDAGGSDADGDTSEEEGGGGEEGGAQAGGDAEAGGAAAVVLRPQTDRQVCGGKRPCVGVGSWVEDSEGTRGEIVARN
eukprot:scaffold47739_cov33-Phaeocystis_antarctica.AAC.1